MKNKRILALLFCLALAVGVLFALNSCGKCTEHTFGEWETTTQATCTSDGERKHTCTKCGETVTEPISATGHTPNRDAATCTEDKTCTVCSTVIEAKKGHTPNRDAATCTEDKTCTVCNTVIEAKKGHTPNRDAATCTEDKVCTACNTVLEEKHHTPNRDAATCTEDKICTACNTVLEEKHHTPNRDAATCTEDKICSVCNTVLDAKKGHALNTVVTPSTCTSRGYTTETCSNCDYTNVKNFKPLSAHTPSITEATCTADQVCSVCNTVLEARTGHRYETTATHDATCTTVGYETKTCENCSDSYDVM